MDGLMGGSWRPTTSHARALLAGTALSAAGVLLRRPDLVVLASPLLAVAVWSSLTRPSRPPHSSDRLLHGAVREGEATAWVASVERVPGLEDVAAAIGVPPWMEARPEKAATAVSATAAIAGDPAAGDAGAGDGLISVTIALRSTRWGTRLIGPAIVAATSSWGAFRWSSGVTGVRPLTTLPQPAVFDSSATNPRPSGLVGLHRSARPGDGSEFADIRPFHVGDRLRRIHWPTSLRTGELHVTTTWADRDTHVALIVDAFNDLGPSDGVDGRASSLDVTVRAAGAIAEHALRNGDRVALRVLGVAGASTVRPAAGRAHLRRVLDRLAAIEPATNWRDQGDPAHFSVSAGVLVVMLSPLVSPVPLQRAVALARHGVAIVVIDTLPADVAEADADPTALLAWRIRLLERETEIRRVQEAGVPVIAWRGPGSLDQVLRDIRRRAGAPRPVLR